MTASRFDLITVDVVDPRDEAAWCGEHLDLVTLEDEDDGRWIVVGSSVGERHLGFQRSTAREVDNRSPSRLSVRLELPIDAQDPPRWASPLVVQSNGAGRPAAVARVRDVDASARFWSDALGLTVARSDGGCHLATSDDDSVMILWDSLDVTQHSFVHLDLACELDDFDAEIERFVDLGAVRIGPKRAESWGTTQILTAPDGIAFCLNAY